MKQIITILLILFTTIVNAQSNWQPLFKNKKLNNFQQLGGTAKYEFKDGILTGYTKPNTPNSFLATKKIYSDFILEFEVKIEYGMNSGVQFRSETNDEKGYVFGYQCEIETSDRKWAGGIYDESRRGWLYPLTRNEKGQNAFKNGTWNTFRIEAIGHTIRTWVNGVQCTNLVDNWTSEGFIAFQVHDVGKHGKANQKVQWKNIRIISQNLKNQRFEPTENAVEISYLNNELTDYEIRKGWRLLWDGETTNGWRSAKSMEFPTKGWSIKDGLLRVSKSNGAESENGGDIITIDQFSNFELSVDFKISKGANSGIKYFVNTDWNKEKGSAIGLEFQVLDDAEHLDAQRGVNGNRTAGALYDLIPPKNLSEPNRDGKRYGYGFNRARIVVKDGKVEHWLNEIKVVEYDKNSQVFEALIQHSKYKNIQGFGQNEKGHILLQDHGDSVTFKNIKIREL
ncbi:MAG: DUF1080 domain-containing protein [Saprospiraceae bacterium]